MKVKLHFVLHQSYVRFYTEQKRNELKWNCYFIGMLVGSYFWGCLADTKGRRTVLIATLLIDGFCGLLSSVAQYYSLFMLFRFFNGFGWVRIRFEKKEKPKKNGNKNEKQWDLSKFIYVFCHYTWLWLALHQNESF